MANEMPVVPKAEQLIVHTGNIVNWNRIKRKLTQSPTDELSECIRSTMNDWLEKADKAELQYVNKIECATPQHTAVIAPEEREELKITVKIFLDEANKDLVKEAIHTVNKELGVTGVETALVSLPDSMRTPADIQPVWEALEELRERDMVYSMGVADFSKEELEQLHDRAKVKPCINQVNLAHCCVIPPDLTQFAKENDIQLLTHNDPKEILPAEQLQTLLQQSLTTTDGLHWQPSWVGRYSVVVKCRGVVHSKGYVVKATRNTKRQN